MVVVFAVVAPWLIVGCICWVGYHLMQQNGRLLLRLEALERLAETPTARGPSQAMPTGLPLGSTAPVFELAADLMGHRTKLSDYCGRQVLLIFFNPAFWFCQQMTPQPR
jgi:hypothetical protein